MLVKLEAPVKLNAGTDCRLVQLLNIDDALLTADILNRGTVCRLAQPLNILDMFVTATVLNKGTD
jgi:hypothetical protein